MSNLIPGLIDKDEIKRRLPLAYVCYRLGINLDPNTAEALCPFHHDSRPSFYLWQGDDDHVRWACQPCGKHGDIYDLLREKEGLTFSQAVDRAEEMLAALPAHEGSYQSPRAAPPRQTPADWFTKFEQSRFRAAEPQWLGRLSTLTGLCDGKDEAEALAWDDFLRSKLFWGVTPEGEVTMPHYDPEWQLTGVKIRDASGSRRSEEGSKYDYMYGCWQRLGDRLPTKNVLVCEGETDMAWAAYEIARLGLDVTAMALPGGARRPPTPLQVDALKGAECIYLALDPDRAGIEATRVWVQFLAEVSLFRIKEVKVCRLPIGRDLRETKPDLKQLLDRARQPLPPPQGIDAPPAIPLAQGYLRTMANGNPLTITQWWLEPLAQLTGGDEEPGYKVELQTQGWIEQTVIRLVDLTSVQKLRAWCSQHGILFGGTDKEVQLIAQHLAWRGSYVPVIYQTDRCGLQGPPREYRTAPPTVVTPTGYQGLIPYQYSPGPRKANVSGQVEIPALGQFNWQWLQDFLLLSHPSVTHRMLAWLCAAARRPEVRDFPLLFIGGPSGTGKSTLAKLVMQLGGSRIESTLGGNTPYILMQKLASTTSIPVFIDEWTRMSRKDSREALQGLIPVIYEGTYAQRGMADLGSVVYTLTAPTIIAGEDTMQLDRELDRVISIEPQAKYQDPDALSRIATQPLEQFAKLMAWFITTQRDLLQPLVPALRSPDRPAHNMEVLQGGWRTLQAVLALAREVGDNVPDIPLLPSFEPPPDEQPERRRRENVYEAAVQECSSMRDAHGNPVAWPDEDGAGTWIRFTALYPVAERSTDLEFPGRSRAMHDYFRSKYTVREGRERPPLGQHMMRAHLVLGFHVDSEEEE
jgi:CHC2 zinc finger